MHAGGGLRLHTRRLLVAADHAADVPYPDSLEFAREYGYGVSTDVWGLDAASARDPNEEYVASMSPEERRAYYTTLLGDDAARGVTGADEAYASEVEERTARFERQGAWARRTTR